ncbi:MAG: hypothetical protein FJ405_11615 [Verrucomicrobia bacterium]|nr:hypothetical protein [Verrucomicrobiota bacterium]
MKLRFALIALCLSAASACVWSQSQPVAPKKPGDAVTLGTISIKGEVKPGNSVTAVVQFKIDPGFHVQANPTSEPNFIPAVLRLEPAADVQWSPPTYPPAKEEKVQGLEKPLKVYEKTFEILVPVKIGAKASLPVRIPAVLSYQACKGPVCYAPRKLKLEIPIGP